MSLLGANFQAGARVRFGLDDGTIEDDSPTTVDVRTPARLRGSVAVWLVNPDGTQAQAPSTFLYLAPPTILGVAPARGPASGGTTVTINGDNLAEDPFGDVPTVLFCDDYAASSNCVAADPDFLDVTSDGRTITLKSPARAPGVVDVAVLAPDGQEDIALSAFTFTELPTVADIAPDAGPTNGGQMLRVTGTGFQPGISVTIDGAACTDVNLVDSTDLTCTTPSGGTGIKDVALQNPDGGTVVVTGGYTYLAPPILFNVVPNLAPEGQQIETVLQGQNLSLQATVHFESTVVPEADILSRSSTLIRLRVPQLSGSVDVVVTNPDGQEARIVDGFSFIPPLPPPTALYILPRTGQTFGGETFRIAGAQFLDGVIVEFGKAPNWAAAPPATLEVRNNGTLITGITPAGDVGLVDVRITNSDGQSTVLTDAYEYVPAAADAELSIVNLEPPRSVIGGGGFLSIAGTGFQPNVQVTFVQNGMASPSTQIIPFGPTLVRARIPAAPAGVPGKATIILTNPPTAERPTAQSAEFADFFEYVSGPVFVRDPGDRLPNERTGDTGAFIFDATGDGFNDVLVARSGGDRLLVNRWNGQVGWFSEQSIASNGSSFQNAHADDYDADGDLDLIRHSGGRRSRTARTSTAATRTPTAARSSAAAATATWPSPT